MGFFSLWNPVVLLLLFNIFYLCQAETKPKLRVTTLIEEPFLTEIENIIVSDFKKDQYEGFTKDLADTLARELDFDYDLQLVPDKSLGRRNEQTSKWSGLVGQLEDDLADIAIAQLTITHNRSQVIDFSTPFMEFQLGILIYSPNADDDDDDDDDENDGQFVFFHPFTPALWIVSIIGALLVVFLIFLTEKFVSAKIKGDVRDVGFFDGFCTKVFGPPRSIAARILQITFWVFIIILISSYIANFAADRVMDQSRHEKDLPINSFEDLLKQDDDFQFGIVRSGSTFQYFSTTEDEDYKKLYEEMREHSNFLENNTKGIERVRKEKGNFAFIMEGPAARYASIKKPCNLELIPMQFGPRKGFGVATRKNSEWSRKINLEIMELKENGVLDDLENKWFEDLSDCPDDDDEDNDFDIVHEHSPLTHVDMAGAFYLLLGSLIIAVGLAFVEISLSTAKYK